MRALALLALLALTGTAFAGGVSNPGGGSGSVSCGTGITGCPSGPLATTVTLNAQTTTPYNVVSTDSAKTVTLTNAGLFTVNIPQATTAGFGVGYASDFEGLGTGCSNLTPATSTISTLSVVQICQGQAAFVFSDGTNFWADVTLPLMAANTVLMNNTGATAYPVAVATTGTVAVVMSTSPTLVTPTLGVASATSLAITGGSAPAIGIYSTGANNLSISTNTAQLMFFNTGGLNSAAANGGELLNSNATATQPSFTPNRADGKAGIGAASSGHVTIIGDNAGTATNVGDFTGTTVAFPTVTTGTNTDFVCMAASNILTLQTSACTISSRRFKDIQGPYVGNALNGLMELPIQNWTYKKSMGPNHDPNTYRLQTGLIAEDVAKQFPMCAVYEKNMKTVKSYRETCVIAMLVKGVQQLQAEISDLKHGQ